MFRETVPRGKMFYIHQGPQIEETETYLLGDIDEMIFFIFLIVVNNFVCFLRRSELLVFAAVISEIASDVSNNIIYESKH